MRYNIAIKCSSIARRVEIRGLILFVLPFKLI